MSTHPSQQKLSIIVPCYNEREVIDATYRRLVETLRFNDLDLELVFVDDGSWDGTAEKLRQIQRADDRVRVIFLARNFGHQLAATAGFEQATGDAVVLIDADLQDPPELIRDMVQRWREGYDVVYGRRTEPHGKTAVGRLTTGLFYWFINRMAETPIPNDTGDFRLLNRKVVDALRKMPEQSRFLGGLVSWVGFRQLALPYQRDKRFAGSNKFRLSKVWKFATNAVVSCSTKPLRLATVLGVLLAAVGAGGLIATAILWFAVTPLTALTGAVLGGVAFCAGLQLLCLGILGEYVGRIYKQAQGRPLYLIRETLGGETVSAETPPAGAVPDSRAA